MPLWKFVYGSDQFYAAQRAISRIDERICNVETVRQARDILRQFAGLDPLP